ncbi:MAG: tetratricopeptide repeat protein [Acidobacteria bacterium]|nr:tetratricopeptide repeat protein [Acidobacteriota bacterium]
MSDTTDVERLLERALEAFGQAEFDEARHLLERLLSTQPDHARAWSTLGICHLETGRTQLGLEALERAIEAEPDNPDHHYWLGNAAGSLGQLDRAYACYQRALELDPQHVKAGEFLVRTRSLLDSREHYRTALQLLRDKQPPQRYLTLALRELLHSMARFPQSPARGELGHCAREILKAARDVAVMLPPGEGLEEWARHHEQGNAGLRFVNHQQALAAYEHALGYKDDDPYAWHGLALAQALGGDLDNAARSWQRCLDLDPEFDFTTLARIQRHSQ